MKIDYIVNIDFDYYEGKEVITDRVMQITCDNEEQQTELYNYFYDNSDSDIYCEEDCVCCEVYNKEEYNELKNIYKKFKEEHR